MDFFRLNWSKACDSAAIHNRHFFARCSDSDIALPNLCKEIEQKTGTDAQGGGCNLKRLAGILERQRRWKNNKLDELDGGQSIFAETRRRRDRSLSKAIPLAHISFGIVEPLMIRG